VLKYDVVVHLPYVIMPFDFAGVYSCSFVVMMDHLAYTLFEFWNPRRGLAQTKVNIQIF
jgi:hypothetical protein